MINKIGKAKLCPHLGSSSNNKNAGPNQVISHNTPRMKKPFPEVIILSIFNFIFVILFRVPGLFGLCSPSEIGFAFHGINLFGLFGPCEIRNPKPSHGINLFGLRGWLCGMNPLCTLFRKYHHMIFKLVRGMKTQEWEKEI